MIGAWAGRRVVDDRATGMLGRRRYPLAERFVRTVVLELPGVVEGPCTGEGALSPKGYDCSKSLPGYFIYKFNSTYSM